MTKVLPSSPYGQVSFRILAVADDNRAVVNDEVTDVSRQLRVHIQVVQVRIFLLLLVNFSYILVTSLEYTVKHVILTLKAPPIFLQQTSISNFADFSKITNKA